jgi:hypothetical protein
VTPWFCSATCTAVIGDYQVYFNQYHVMGSYAASLEGVLSEALQLPVSTILPTTLPTKILRPTNGAVLRGTVVLGAGAQVDAGTRVQFILAGHGYHETVIATAQPSVYGWFAFWNTTTVRNGTYTLESSVRRGGGAGVSRAVRVQVKN